MSYLPLDNPAQALLIMYSNLVRQYLELDVNGRPGFTYVMTIDTYDEEGNVDRSLRYTATRHEPSNLQ